MSINQDHIGDANKMVSSIEFLVKEINQIIDFIPMNKWDEIRIVVEQAKVMHKEEIETTYEEGMFHHIYGMTPNEYYEKTFNTKEK